MRSYPARTVGFIEKYLPSLKEEVKILDEIIDSQGRETVRARRCGGSSGKIAFTGDENADVAVEMAGYNRADIDKILKTMATMSASMGNKRQASGGGTDQGTPKRAKNTSASIGAAIELIKKRCPSLDHSKLPKQALKIAAGTCVICGAKYNPMTPCCVGKKNVSAAIIEKINALATDLA
jgi:hypothetical protein